MSTPEEAQQTVIQKAKAWGGKSSSPCASPALTGFNRMANYSPHRKLCSTIITGNVHLRTACKAFTGGPDAIPAITAILDIFELARLQN